MNDLYYEDYGNGIYAIDSYYQRPRMAACYLVVQGDQAAIVETGVAKGIPYALALMEKLGIGRDMVRYVMPTHVHLDHAGGAGRMMSLFPQAQLVVHPQGARHLIDPAKLRAGAIAVYGEERFREYYGEIDPIPAARVIEAEDGFSVNLDGRELVCFDTPGHARLHYCVYDTEGGGIITGDTFGLCYPELADNRGPFVMATTTPVQFDPDAWLATIDRLLAEGPRYMYLTHFGRVEGVTKLADELRRDIDAHVEMALAAPAEGREAWLRDRVADHFKSRLGERGCTFKPAFVEAMLAPDAELNAQGLEVWLQRRAKAALD